MKVLNLYRDNIGLVYPRCYEDNKNRHAQKIIKLKKGLCMHFQMHELEGLRYVVLKKTGTELSYEAVEELAENLIQGLEIVYQPIKVEDMKKLRDQINDPCQLPEHLL